MNKVAEGFYWIIGAPGTTWSVPGATTLAMLHEGRCYFFGASYSIRADAAIIVSERVLPPPEWSADEVVALAATRP